MNQQERQPRVTFRRDEHGIPIVSKLQIDALAEQFLEFAYIDALKRPMGVPISDVVDKLRETGKCTFSDNEELGFDAQGRPYLGHYSVTRNHISISARIDPPDPRYVFTCAHEFGHFYLHQAIEFSAVIEEGAPEIRDSSRELMTYRTEARRPRSRLEWQANRFAAGMLMPASTVPLAVRFAQQKLGINRLGRIWLDRQPQNQRAYHAIVERLAGMFKVSKAVVKFRLHDMDLLQIAPNYELRPVGEQLGAALWQLFGE